MSNPYWTPVKTVLLTGAGFSKPFGGYLASEMWSLILNQPEICASQNLHGRLLEDLNYERIYDEVLSTGNPAEQDALTAALQNAYRQLDKAICSEQTERRGETAAALNVFLGRFGGIGKERGFIFTLNQDLLIERFYTNDNLMQTPGFGHHDWFTQRFRTVDTPPNVTLPDNSKVEHSRAGFWSKGQNGDFVYIKLHGSYGWKSAHGTNSMALGYAKVDAIEKEPLLRWYKELFKEVLERPGQRLVIVGYGFGDEHINDVLANAVKKGLEIHMISPKEPKEAKDLLRPLHGVVAKPPHRGAEIWAGVYGYYCASVPEFISRKSSGLTAKGEAFFRRVELA